MGNWISILMEMVIITLILKKLMIHLVSGGIRPKMCKILLYGGSGFFNVTAGTIRIIDDTFYQL